MLKAILRIIKENCSWTKFKNYDQINILLWIFKNIEKNQYEYIIIIESVDKFYIIVFKNIKMIANFCVNNWYNYCYIVFNCEGKRYLTNSRAAALRQPRANDSLKDDMLKWMFFSVRKIRIQVCNWLQMSKGFKSLQFHFNNKWNFVVHRNGSSPIR